MSCFNPWWNRFWRSDFIKKRTIAVIAVCAAAVLGIAAVLLLRGRADDIPYNDILARMKAPDVESAALLIGRPVREGELTEDELAQLLPLLNKVKLKAFSDPEEYYVVGDTYFYDLRLRLRDGTDFILSISDLFFWVWPDSEAYYYGKLPKNREGPTAYSVELFPDGLQDEIVSLMEKIEDRVEAEIE